MGRSAGSLGVSGAVDGAALSAVLGGRHPVTGAQLRDLRYPVRVPGFELTFGAPKSVSVLGGLCGGEVAAEVDGAQASAVGAAVGYLEREAARARRGAGWSPWTGWSPPPSPTTPAVAETRTCTHTCWWPTSCAGRTDAGARWRRAVSSPTQAPPLRCTPPSYGAGSPTAWAWLGPGTAMVARRWRASTPLCCAPFPGDGRRWRPAWPSTAPPRPAGPRWRRWTRARPRTGPSPPSRWRRIGGPGLRPWGWGPTT